MKKNVAIIIQKLKNGGAERAAANLSKDLSDKCNIFIITFDAQNICYDYSGELIDLNLPATSNMFKKAIVFLRRIKKVKKIKKEKNIDVAISFMEGANLVNVLSKEKECVITSERNLPSFFYKRKFKLRFICNKADKIVTLSKLVKKDLVKNYGISAEKIVPIYNSCDKKRLIETSKEVDKIIEKLDKNKRYIVTMGRLNYQKGQWHLIKAFKKVKEEIEDVDLLILGKGEMENDLKELAEKLGIETSVKFLGYLKNPHKILNYCDVFVFSSIVEGLGNVLLEALAFDKAIISTDCDAGPREILAPDTNMDKKTNEIEYGKYGVLVPTFNEKHIDKNNIFEMSRQELILADAIIKMLKNEKLRKQYENNAKERIKDFQPNKIKEEWINLIERI